jgi:hypothetical protein
MRAPPALKLMTRGCQRRLIPLAFSREMQAPSLTPAALFEEQARLDGLRLEIYNRILATVHNKIRATSTLPSSPQMTYFDVPEWQPGCPRYDVKDCILYIVWQLRHSGFHVLYVSPNRLLISWKQQSIQYYTEESPIRQAMAATATAAATPTATTTTAAAPPKKKSTTSYRPAAPEGVAGMLAAGAKKGGPSTITFI